MIKVPYYVLDDARVLGVQRNFSAKKKVRDTLKRIDPDGTNDRWRTAVHRREYKVPTPNFLWHIDGHMKLIRY